MTIAIQLDIEATFFMLKRRNFLFDLVQNNTSALGYKFRHDLKGNQY